VEQPVEQPAALCKRGFDGARQDGLAASFHAADKLHVLNTRRAVTKTEGGTHLNKK